MRSNLNTNEMVDSSQQRTATSRVAAVTQDAALCNVSFCAHCWDLASKQTQQHTEAFRSRHNVFPTS